MSDWFGSEPWLDTFGLWLVGAGDRLAESARKLTSTLSIGETAGLSAEPWQRFRWGLVRETGPHPLNGRSRPAGHGRRKCQLPTARERPTGFGLSCSGVSGLAYHLHKLTARMDRVADDILKREVGISYARFLALFAVRQGATTQRELAVWLGVSEPSVSRMAGVLCDEGLILVERVPGLGNRRRLALTQDGEAVVDRGGRLLDSRFTQLVENSGVRHGRYETDTRRLVAQLEAEGVGPLVSRSSGGAAAFADC